MGYLTPEVALGDWAIAILEVQVPIYASMRSLLGVVGHKIDKCIRRGRAEVDHSC